MNKPGQNATPSPLSEAQLLAFIEGAAAAADRAAIERALAADPALAPRLDALAADRAAIASLPELDTPAGLVARAISSARSTRGDSPGTLLTLDLHDPEGETVIPQSQVFPLRASPWERLGLSRINPRRMAMAAAIVLALGGLFTVLHVIQRASWSAAEHVGPMTMDRGDTSSPLQSTEPRDHPRVMADHRMADEHAALHDSMDADEPAAVLAQATAPPPESPEAMAIERAVRLAAEGRLVIRVSTTDTHRAVARLDRQMRIVSGRDGWRIERTVMPEVVALMEQRYQPPSPDTRVLASDQQIEISGIGIEHPPRRAVVYAGHTRLDTASLRALLESAGPGAFFEASLQPMPAATLPMDPLAVIWWESSPDGWVDWVSVPIVVTPAE